jgi:deoxyribonuclease-4
MTQLGAHIDQLDPIAEARALGANLSQLFLGDPQGWRGPQVAYLGGAAALKADAEAAGVALVVHSPYVLNVASTNNRIRIPSRQQLQKQLTAAAEIGAIGVVVHGGHVTASDDPEAGYQNWRKAVDGLSIDAPLLIENTAGGGNAMARGLEKIDRLWSGFAGSPNADRVGFCLDTCHAHASGEELLGLVERVRAITGRVDLVHVNDSRDAFGSRADRHANLGRGNCDPLGLADVVRTAGCPLVVETPGGVAEHLADLEWIRTALQV